jgi:hypothetical protein
MLNYFRAAAPMRMADPPDDESLGEWLTLAQHWGLPTRLLDWTSSLMVAAYFAVRGTETATSSSTIWILNPFGLNTQCGHPSYKFQMTARRVRPYLEAAFYHDAAEPGDYLAILGHERNTRVLAQQGAFTLHSSRTPLELADGAHNWLARIDIPAESVERLRYEVRLSGQKRSTMFPDLRSLSETLVADESGHPLI